MQFRRREFLSAAAVMALFYGIGRLTLGARDAPPATRDDRPQWLRSALADMKSTNSPGIAIVLPPGAAERERLRSTLESVLDVQSAPSCLVEAVFLVAEAGWVGAGAGDTLVLLDFGRTACGQNHDASRRGLHR